jgi:cobalt-zinc-cadmium efflux system membrane fusion protein
LVVVIVWAGCQRSQPAAVKAAASPSKMTHPVAESGLNTIELTEEAVKRLGLQTAVAETRSMVRTRPYGADVVLPTGSMVVVSAPLAGTLKPVDGLGVFQVGQRIPEGTSLLKLLPLLSPERSVLTPVERIRLAEAKNTLAQSQIDAEGQVQQASVQMEAAQVALARAEKLLKDMAGSSRIVDEAKAQLQLTEKAYAAAKTRKQQIDSVSFDEAAGTLEAIPIPSPLTGILRTTLVRPGEMVAAEAPLCEVMQDDVLWVKVPVYVGELDELNLAQSARLSLLNGRHSETDLLVKPAALPPTAVPLAAAVDLYFELPNPERKYQPGQKISAHLTLKGEAQQVAIPWSAVYHDIYGGQWVYEQTSDRHFVRRRVEIGWVDGEWAAVTRGLQPGVKVVTAGAAEIAGTEFGFAK